MPEAKETEDPPSRPPTISSSASQLGVPSSREYARRSPSTKFDAGHGGTFSGEPGRRSRPAETSHDSTEPRSPALCSAVFFDVIVRFYRRASSYPHIAQRRRDVRFPMPDDDGFGSGWKKCVGLRRGTAWP